MIANRITELRYVKASDLRPNARNWRTHPTAQRDALKGLLAEIGYADALIAREDDDGTLVLIDGHLRAETTPDTEVPVLITDLTAAEADRVLLTLDPLAAMAGRNTEHLKALASEFQTDNEALMQMVQRLTGQAGGGLEDPEPPPPPENPITKPGDVWVLGRHRLVCGDSTRAEDYANAAGGHKPFIMVTDPPYGVNYDAAWRHAAGLNNSNAIGKVTNDDQAEWLQTYQHFTGAVAYVWHGGRHAGAVARNLQDAGMQIRAMIVWAKPAIVISRGHYHWQHEPCWYAVRKRRQSKWAGDGSQSTVWTIPQIRARASEDDGKIEHSTRKPIECMARPMRNHGKAGDVVYDPFLGSGTTLIAAEQLDRTCVGLEIAPAYCDIIVERWQQMTGGKAERA